MERDQRKEYRRLSWWSLLSIGLLWLAGCTSVEAVRSTLVPTISLPTTIATEIPTIVDTQTSTPTPTLTATVTSTSTPEPIISSEMIVTMGSNQVRATDLARSSAEVSSLIEKLPKPITEASVALYAINLESGRFELAGTGIVVEYDEVNKRGVIMTTKHVLEAKSGAFLQNLQVGQPHKNNYRLTLNNSSMDIIPGPYGDIGFVEFEYKDDPPFPALGRENIEVNAVISQDASLGMLSFTDSASVHTVYPVVNFGLSKQQPELFDAYWNLPVYLIEPLIAKRQSGTSVVEMESGKVVGVVYAMHPNGGAITPIYSETFEVLDQLLSRDVD